MYIFLSDFSIIEKNSGEQFWWSSQGTLAGSFFGYRSYFGISLNRKWKKEGQKTSNKDNLEWVNYLKLCGLLVSRDKRDRFSLVSRVWTLMMIFRKKPKRYSVNNWLSENLL